MPRSVDRHSRKDRSLLQEDESSMPSSESSSVDASEPSTSSAAQDEADRTSVVAFPPERSSTGSPHGSSKTAQQSSQHGATNSAHVSLKTTEQPSRDDEVASPENRNTRVSRKSRTRPRSISVEDIDEGEAESQQSPPTRGRGGRRGRGRGRGRRGLGRSVRDSTNPDDEAGLFHDITNDPSSLPDIVVQWIENYKSDRGNATLSLTRFFVSSCGVGSRVTSKIQASTEHEAIIRLMTESDSDGSADYPLVEAGRWKKLRAIYGDFLNILVRHCRNSIIYDQYLMDKMITLLTGLSSSPVRAFRHTATFASMKLMTALVDVAVTVSSNLANTSRQYDAELGKSRRNRATARLENLASKRRELEENVQELKEMLDFTFKSVFVRRYSDVATDIRTICIGEMGLWMTKFHGCFLDDHYLKYVGWSLFDDAAEVRLKCLEVLEPLLETENFAPKLDLFVYKFKDRIVAMTLDKEYEVAAKAVRILGFLLKHHRDIVTDDDCERVYELVYSAHRDVARAAGEFVNERLFKIDENDVPVVAKTKRGKPRLPNTPMIRDLVTFFIEAESPEHAVFLVDSLIDVNEMMKDWECMTDLLIEEPGTDEEALTDHQETRLIEIMICCVKQTATGEPPVGRELARKNYSAKRPREISDDRRRLTEHFILTLPALLDKYQADGEKIVHLLAAPQYFELEIYRTSRQEDRLDALLRAIYLLVDKMHDVDVLETSAKTLECMCAEGPGIFERCTVARSVTLDRVVARYRKANDRYTAIVDESLTPDDDETFDVVESLRKLSIYYALHDMNSYDVWDSLWKSLEDARFASRRLTDEAVTYCARACYFWILWSQNSLTKAEGSGISLISETRRANERLHSFVDLMSYFVGGDANASAVSSPVVLREEAYNSICDLLIFFNVTMLNHPNPVLHQLVYTPDDNTLTMLSRFVRENVFCEEPEEDRDEDERIELLHKRRNFLAGYCKLVMYGTIPVWMAAEVFKYYAKHRNNYGDILKATIGRARDNNRTNCARTMLRSLKISYVEMVESTGETVGDGEEFTGIKALAKKFAVLFGLDAVRNSEALLALHGDGVVFAITPPDGDENDTSGPPTNLRFLEVLVEFSGKLSADDRSKVLEFVEMEFQGRLPLPQSEDWKPLRLYMNSLKHAGDKTSVTSKRPQTRSETHRAAGEEEADGAGKESIHESVAKRKRKRRPRKPRLSVSTITRRRGPGTSGLKETSDTAPIPVSPVPAIEDSPQDANRENEDRLRFLRIHSPTDSRYELFEDLTV